MAAPSCLAHSVSRRSGGLGIDKDDGPVEGSGASREREASTHASIAILLTLADVMDLAGAEEWTSADGGYLV